MSSLTVSSSVIGLALAYGAVAIQPGANFIVVSSIGMARRREHACLAALGVAGGAALVAGCAFYGTQQLEAVTRQLWILQFVYAAILAKVGIDALSGVRHRAGQAVTAPSSRGGCFRIGFVTAATNPVTVLFLVGIATGPAALGERCEPSAATVTIFAVALAWFSVVALLFSTSRVHAAYERARPWANLATGLLLIFMAFDLAVRTWQNVGFAHAVSERRLPFSQPGVRLPSTPAPAGTRVGEPRCRSSRSSPRVDEDRCRS